MQYTSEDILVMQAMASDIVFAYIDFDGDLISLVEGGHISGNSLTVIINGIAGSLNMRCAFYAKHGDRIFRDHVRLMTYGDDNIGSCDGTCALTIRDISSYLALYGQTYTMPDKDSTLTDFLPYEDFEFLKRKNVYCPERGVHTGALVEKSIFKMLHKYMRDSSSPETPEMAMAMNIDTACREWFHHGRDTYEKRVSEMRQVATEMGIYYLTTQLDRTYAECVDEWREKYEPRTEDVVKPYPVETMGFVNKVEESITQLDTTLGGDVRAPAIVGFV
jgi:hypothetical protein